MAHSLKVAISIDEETLRRVDEAAGRRKVSRSKFIRDAVEREISTGMEEEIVTRLNLVFSDEEAAREQIEVSERFLAASPVKEEPW